MRLASWIIPSYRRPRLLAECLSLVLRSDVPAGWEMEVVVAMPAIDAMAWRIDDPRVRVVGTREHDGCSQLNAALGVAYGELVLTTGDDDLQSPRRLAAACAAYERGHALAGSREFLFFSRQTGQLARWRGNPARCGAVRSYARASLNDAGGWPADTPDADSALDERLRATGCDMFIADLADAIAADTVCTDGAIAVHAGRPFPPPGVRVRFGSYYVTGCGEAELQALPEATRHAMQRCLGQP
jgi:hypothetical protein